VPAVAFSSSKKYARGQEAHRIPPFDTSQLLWEGHVTTAQGVELVKVWNAASSAKAHAIFHN
jgi:hypothetical protein